MVYITDQDIFEHFSMSQCMETIECALDGYRSNQTVNPLRNTIQVDKTDSQILYMPSYVRDINFSSVKVVSVVPTNRIYGRRNVNGILVLSDMETGEHVAVMDATWLTILRTGALTGVATKYLAKEDSKTCLVVGCGEQAMGQVLGVIEARPGIERLLLNSRSISSAQRLAKRLRKYYPDLIAKVEVVDDVNNSVRDADIVVCSTTSELPVFNGELLKHGTHVNAIGSYLPTMREIDETTVVRSSKIVVDSKQGVLKESGDFIIPIRQNILQPEAVLELAEVVGNNSVQRHPSEITLFKSVGVGFIDTYVAHAIYDRLKELNEHA